MPGRVTACPSCHTKNRVPAAATGRPRCASCKRDLPWIADATDADFAQVTTTSELVLVDLWAPWCGPCRMVAPVLEELSKDYAGKIKVVKVNVDNAPKTANRFQAQSIPTLVLLRDGATVDRMIGAQPKQVLVSHIDKALSA